MDAMKEALVMKNGALHKKTAEFLRDTVRKADDISKEYRAAGLTDLADDMATFARRSTGGALAFSIISIAADIPAENPIPPVEAPAKRCMCPSCMMFPPSPRAG